MGEENNPLNNINHSDLFNYLIAREQDNVLEAIRAFELRKEKRIDPVPARQYLNVCLKILILRIDPFLRSANKSRDDYLRKIEILSHDEIVDFYNELAEIISMNTNRRTII